MYDLALLSFRIARTSCRLLAVTLGVVSMAAASHGFAQPPQGPPVFEVTTVKPSDTKNPPPPSVDISRNRFSATGMTLKELIRIAYNLNYGANQQISGGPAWIGSARFDVQAKEDEVLSADLQKLPQQQQGDRIREMLRALLAERFQLQTHVEKKALPVYDLVLARNGPRMVPSSSQPLTSDNEKPAKTPNWIRFAGKGVLEANNADLDTLATVLSMQPEVGGRLVEDKTGLIGGYGFTLKWTPDSGAGADTPAADSGPSLFTALQEQLGLKLEPSKAPVDMIVIDRVELPTQN